MFWQVASFPRCTHHVFLSHSAEDRDGLVWPVYDRLAQARVLPWLDRDHYHYGRDSRAALRDALLRCRHAAFFVTDAMLASARGWCVLELAFAELLELNFRTPGGDLANVILPLFLVPQADDRLPRSVWQAVRDRGRFFDPAAGDPVAWSVRQISEFLRREQRLTTDLSRNAREKPEFCEQLDRTPGLFDRVVRFHPRRLPPA